MLTPELRKLKAILEGKPGKINRTRLLQELNQIDTPKPKPYRDLLLALKETYITRDININASAVCPTCGRPFKKGRNI